MLNVVGRKCWSYEIVNLHPYAIRGSNKCQESERRTTSHWPKKNGQCGISNEDIERHVNCIIEILDKTPAKVISPSDCFLETQENNNGLALLLYREVIQGVDRIN